MQTAGGTPVARQPTSPRPARATVAQGYGGLKFNPFNRQPGSDAHRLDNRVLHDGVDYVAAVRQAVGPDFTLMLDSMWSYSLDEAVRVARAIEELDYFWFEDPLTEQDMYNYVRLRQLLRIPLLATE
jgi:L-alanine-DL-glutamate epimerase-like enolase superfamily enzyme